MTANELISLLGMPHTAPAVQRVLTELGIDPKKVRLKKGDFDVSVEGKQVALELEFADPEKYGVELPGPDGQLVLGHVMIFGPAVAQLGGLPEGLTPLSSRAQAKELLGPPAWTSPVAPIDRWQVNGINLTVRFDRATERAERFTYALPK
jgi:hypothetical protein